jgi:hypothetical protein
MIERQGSTTLLNDPVAQQLLQSHIPARLAYTWSDGTPRVIPIGFHWNGEEIVVGTRSDAPKMKVLRDGDAVALTIDSDTMPYKVLMVRGRIRTDRVDGVAPEYVAMARRILGDAGAQSWVDHVRPVLPSMVRIYITPTWVGILDFETRFPSALEKAVKGGSRRN